MKRTNAREFEGKKQIPSMKVIKDDVCFTQLSCYASYLVQTKRIRIERFMERLVKTFVLSYGTLNEVVYVFFNCGRVCKDERDERDGGMCIIGDDKES